jgi:hypothetical protein
LIFRRQFYYRTGQINARNLKICIHPLFQPVTWLKGSLLIEIVFLYCGAVILEGASLASQLWRIAFIAAWGAVSYFFTLRWFRWN